MDSSQKIDIDKVVKQARRNRLEKTIKDVIKYTLIFVVKIYLVRAIWNTAIIDITGFSSITWWQSFLIIWFIWLAANSPE